VVWSSVGSGRPGTKNVDVRRQCESYTQSEAIKKMRGHVTHTHSIDGRRSYAAILAGPGARSSRRTAPRPETKSANAGVVCNRRLSRGATRCFLRGTFPAGDLHEALRSFDITAAKFAEVRREVDRLRQIVRPPPPVIPKRSPR
jgi:hypothetical protein